MLRLLKATPRTDAYADVFIARYERLLVWSLKLTDHDRQMAEDLVHDTFVQFMLSRPNLNTVQNLEAYLYTMLKNTHLSQLRRASQKPQHNLALIEYDSAEISLRALDVRAKLQIQEELWNVCQYACVRKDSSKAGSVLILRFFQGYYPSEISRILQSSRQTVDSWLRIARREAELYLEDPNSLHASKERIAETLEVISRIKASIDETEEPENLLAALRTAIFASRRGPCLSTKELRQLYPQTKEVRPAAIPTERLGHIVSCLRCLDEVNKMNGLPPLCERDPTGTLGRDLKPGGGGSRFFGVRKKQPLSKCLRRFHETFEHRPRELRIAVNGYVLATQKLSAELNQQELNLDAEGKVKFIEIFSEQNFRLMLLNVESPPEGAFEQQLKIDLSDQRSLEARLNFNGAWPRLNISYRDPLIKAEIDPQAVIAEEEALRVAAVESESAKIAPDTFPARSLSSVQRLWDVAKFSSFWLTPGGVTALAALLVVAALLFNRWSGPEPPVTAANLLQRAVVAENLIAANRDQVSHRTITLEERVSEPRQVGVATGSGGQLLSRHKIEVWQSPEKGITARRLYDEKGRLVAGDWRRSDGVQTLYHHGSQPKLQPAPDKLNAPAINFEEAWQLDPSAGEFSQLIANNRGVRVEERGNTYVIYAESVKSADSSVIEKATLILNRNDLHPIEQTLVVRQDNETREFHFIETSFERRPTSAVAPAVFEPEPELVGDTETRRHADTENIAASARLTVPASPALATPALEVEVLGLLNNAGAFMGEQLRVTHTPEGKLLVSGLVDTAERKGELLRALATVRNNPAVRIEIETAAEAARRERPKSFGNITVERVEATEGTSPVYAELRKKFSDEEARRFADRILNRSLQARSHALALKQLAERFSQADLQTLTSADRALWLGLLREHAAAYERDVEALQRELQTVFPQLGGAPGAAAINGDAELQDAALRLYQLSVTCDEAVRQSFALSAKGGTGAPVKSAQFWESLKSAKALASRIHSVR